VKVIEADFLVTKRSKNEIPPLSRKQKIPRF
jgi:hypothetical protein